MKKTPQPFREILTCVDGSPLAERILPVAQGIASAAGAQLTLLRVVDEVSQFAAEETSLRELAQRYQGQLRFVVGRDPALAIAAELRAHDDAIAALTSHGRSAWAEAILGSVAFKIIQNSPRPLLLFRPLDKQETAPKHISTLAAAIDNQPFSETILPFAAAYAKALNAQLTLLQVVSERTEIPSGADAKPDLVETAYLHSKAAEITQRYGIKPQWEILHGDPGDALCRYVEGSNETLLAITTHARGGLGRTLFGSVAAHCVRHAGVPLLIYWPADQ